MFWGYGKAFWTHAIPSFGKYVQNICKKLIDSSYYYIYFVFVYLPCLFYVFGICKKHGVQNHDFWWRPIDEYFTRSWPFVGGGNRNLFKIFWGRRPTHLQTSRENLYTNLRRILPALCFFLRRATSFIRAVILSFLVIEGFLRTTRRLMAELTAFLRTTRRLMADLTGGEKDAFTRLSAFFLRLFFIAPSGAGLFLEKYLRFVAFVVGNSAPQTQHSYARLLFCLHLHFSFLHRLFLGKFSVKCPGQFCE